MDPSIRAPEVIVSNWTCRNYWSPCQPQWNAAARKVSASNSTANASLKELTALRSVAAPIAVTYLDRKIWSKLRKQIFWNETLRPSRRSLRWTQTNCSTAKAVHASDQDVAKGTASASNLEYPALNGASARFVTTTSQIWQRIQQKRRKCREIRVNKMRQLILLRKVRMEKTKKVVIKQKQLRLPIRSSRWANQTL